MDADVPNSQTRHQELVLGFLRGHGSLTRGELGELSGLSRTTLYDTVATLVDRGTLITSVPRSGRRRRGRPAERLVLNPEQPAPRAEERERGGPPIARPAAGAPVEPGMRLLLNSLTGVPAQVTDDLTHVLAQNSLSHALFGPWERQTGRRANLAWRWFVAPTARTRDFLEDSPRRGRQLVADLRAAWTARGRDRVSRELVADLRAVSTEFARYWDECDAWDEAAEERSRPASRALVHPELGRLDVRDDAVLSESTGHRLTVLWPQEGTGTAERLASLRAMTRQPARPGRRTAAGCFAGRAPVPEPGHERR